MLREIDRWMYAMPALSVTKYDVCLYCNLWILCKSTTNPERRWRQRQRWTKWSIISIYIQTTFIAFDVFVARVFYSWVLVFFPSSAFCFYKTKQPTDDGIMKNNSKNISKSMHVLVCSMCVQCCIIEKYCLLTSLRMYCVTYAMHCLLCLSV